MKSDLNAELIECLSSINELIKNDENKTNGFEFSASDIIYVESDNRKITVYLKNKIEKNKANVTNLYKYYSCFTSVKVGKSNFYFLRISNNIWYDTNSNWKNYV